MEGMLGVSQEEKESEKEGGRDNYKMITVQRCHDNKKKRMRPSQKE
jgi:hypothetical protein